MADLLTTKELQEILNIDRTTIYRMAESGRVPAVKVGNQWRFPKQQIETWLQRQSVAALPSANRQPPATAMVYSCSLWSASNSFRTASQMPWAS